MITKLHRMLPIPIPSFWVHHHNVSTQLLSLTTATTTTTLATVRMGGVRVVVAWVFLGWYCFVWGVCGIGFWRMWKTYGYPPPATSASAAAAATVEGEIRGESEEAEEGGGGGEQEADLPFVSILRPIKGFDPNLHLCLTSTCNLTYPREKHELLFCVASPHDTSIPVIRDVLAQNPQVDARLVIGEEDVGPNPKIRNLSRGYREARGDVVWVLDSNVFVLKGVLGRSVRLLERYKLVHHLPLCVDVTGMQGGGGEQPGLGSDSETPLLGGANKGVERKKWFWKRWWESGGGRLEENFLSSSHCKFYTAINTTGLAPCIVGKSNLFRRSHLAQVTRNTDGDPEGILYFAENICEDHLLAEQLWLGSVDDEKAGTRKWGRHGLGADLVFQPVSHMTIGDYLARRTRWLRVRKFTVIAATLLEPGTESFAASLMAAYACTTIPFFCTRLSIPTTWTAFWLCWLLSVAVWAFADRRLFLFLHSYRSSAIDGPDSSSLPAFLKNRYAGRRPLGEWVLQWIGREACAAGVWVAAMSSSEVNWRGGSYRVRWKDMKVQEIVRDRGKKD